MLSICSMLKCSILNGAVDLCFDNFVTYLSSTGESLIDYFILSNDLCQTSYVKSLKVLERFESDHLPISLELNIKDNPLENEKCQRKMSKLVWNKEKENQFLSEVNSEAASNAMALALNNIKHNINMSLDQFVSLLVSASQCMKREITLGGRSKAALTWFDEECYKGRQLVRAKLRKYRRTHNACDRNEYVQQRTDYKKLLKQKKQNFRKTKVEYLMKVIKQPSAFWNEIRKCVSYSRNRVSTNISREEWVNHFKGVLMKQKAETENDMNLNVPLVCDEVLDEEISEDEIKFAVSKLKNGKASGHDEILGEMLKSGHKQFEHYLLELFNEIFSTCQFPSAWTRSIIVPIHKKGDTECVQNYRGVSLLSIVSKCYTSILNRRLYEWAEDNGKLLENQAGFRRNYSTTDHIFTLYAITQKYLSKKGGKLYVAFVDLKQAFDTVDHTKLFNVLISNGISAKFLKAIMSIYKSMSAYVRVNHEITEEFVCERGLRQGCILSPTLFSLFINDVAKTVNENGKHGIQLLPGLLEAFILLFADDLALMSSTPHGLQNQLDSLAEACKCLGLEVNTTKTKVMVFRKGGFLGKHDKWYLGSEQLEVVNRYTYLGFVFTTTMSIAASVKSLALKGKQSTFNMLRATKKLEATSKDIVFKIFDVQVQPTLLYAAEMWGLLYEGNEIEKVHTYMCKRFLNVSVKTPNTLVYGELGRLPLKVYCFLRVINYWFKLLEMQPSRLPLQAYKMLFALDEQGKTNWVTKLRCSLFTLGFGYVWQNQGVGNKVHFRKSLKQRLVDVYQQEWFSDINSSQRFSLYKMFKHSFVFESYLDFVNIQSFRTILTHFRFGISDLKSHRNRYNTNDANNNCPFCINEDENEYHFLYRCPKYENIRPVILKNIENVHEQTHFNSLLLCEKENKTKQLSWFLFKAFDMRKLCIENGTN